MATMSFGENNAAHGKWNVFTTMLSVEDLIELLSKNVSPNEEIWKTDFYSGNKKAGVTALQREPTASRIDPLKRYIESNIVDDNAVFAGALPALSVAVMGDLKPSPNGGIIVKWDNDFKAVLVDGMGRYSSLSALFASDRKKYNINVPVTFYTMEGLEEDGCRQILHDFNRYATTMRPVSASQFDSNDILRPFADSLYEKLTQAGFRVSKGHMANASYMFYTSTDRFYSATKETKNRKHLLTAEVVNDKGDVDTIAQWVVDCINIPSAKKNKLKATTVQNLLHGLSQVRGVSASDVRVDFTKPFVSTLGWNDSLRVKDQFDRNQRLLNLRTFAP